MTTLSEDVRWTACERQISELRKEMKQMESTLLAAVRGETAAQDEDAIASLVEENIALKKEVERLRELSTKNDEPPTPTKTRKDTAPPEAAEAKREVEPTEVKPPPAAATGADTVIAPSSPHSAVPAAKAVPRSAQPELPEPEHVSSESHKAIDGIRGMAGIEIDTGCRDVFNKVRRERFGLRWATMGFDKTGSWIVPLQTQKATEDFKADWEGFIEELPDSKSLYAIYAFDYVETNGAYSDGDTKLKKSKLVLFTYTPKTCPMTSKMLVASSAASMQQVCKGTIDASFHDKEQYEEWNEAAILLGIEIDEED